MSGFGITRWVALLGVGIVFYGNCAHAQITPDGTLPNNSNVSKIRNTFNITGGTQAGSNLFHSFGQFSLPTGGTAFFNNALDIQNIIGRVTGGSISNINGLIRANGAANLFLINPSGIVFGKNASLNVGGSFLASTANSLKFADGFEFSATSPQSTPLLTISVPIGLQFGQNPGSIQNQSVATNSNGESVGLQVEPGKTLALVGGEVRLDGGLLQAANGRIELAAVAGQGTAGLNITGNKLSLSFPDNLLRADVSLTNAAKVDVSDRGQGSVGVTARNLNILGESSITSGIKQGLETDGSLPGNITLNATGLLTINNLSRVTNVVPQDVIGNAGDINITAGDIYIDNRASITRTEFVPAALEASSGGKGRAGNISLSTTGSINLIGQDVDYGDFVISTFFLSSQVPGGGDITLTANASISLETAYLSAARGNGGGNISLLGKQSVSITKQSLLDAGTDQGNSGNITITSDGPISIDRSFLGNNVGINKFPTVPGNAGDIKISGGSVFVTGGSLIESSSEEKGGNSGNISLFGREKVEISGYNQQFPGTRTFKFPYTTLRTTSLAGSLGQGGKITVNAPTFRVSDKAIVRTDSQSDFRGGDINVNANIVELMGGGQLFTTAGSSGNAGDIALNVGDRIVLSGTNPNYTADKVRFGDKLEAVNASSGLFANTQTGTGNGGNIEINTRNLSINNGAGIGINSLGQGSAGSFLNINARDQISLANGFITSSLGTEATGQGGTINLTAGSLSLTDGAKVEASTSGQGDAGIINAQVKDRISLTNNSQIQSSVERTATGNGTQISISGRSLSLTNNSQITAQSRGTGNAGNIKIDANTFDAVSGGKLLTTTSGSGNAGNIRVNLSDRFSLSGANTGLFANTEPGSSGNGGNIFIHPKTAVIQDGAGVSVGSQGTGIGGNIQFKADTLKLDNRAFLSAETASTQGGNIEIKSEDLLLLRRNSLISTTAGNERQGGNGGNITINSPNGFIVAVPNEDSDITANASTGSGGKVNIRASGIYGIESRSYQTDLSDITASSELGVQGTININTPNVDPNRGLLRLSTGIVNTPRLVASNCNAFIGKKGSEFTVTGRGGLPPSPDDFLSSDVVWTDSRLIATTAQQSRTSAAKPPKPKIVEILPATGWVFNDKGEVTLISSAANATANVSPPTCAKQ